MHLLNVLAAWEAIDGVTASTSAAPVPEAVLHAVCDGVFPWQGAAGAGNGLHSAQRHFALQYRTLSNDLERTLEQVTVLRTDMVRLLNWLEERIDLIAECAAVQTHGINVCEAAAAAAPTRRQIMPLRLHVQQTAHWLLASSLCCGMKNSGCRACWQMPGRGCCHCCPHLRLHRPIKHWS